MFQDDSPRKVYKNTDFRKFGDDKALFPFFQDDSPCLTLDIRMFNHKKLLLKTMTTGGAIMLR